MSYDLAIYTTRVACAEELEALVTAAGGLQVSEVSDGSLVVVRGARRRFSFTVDGPVAAELEDLPTDVAALVLSTRWVYSVSVEGTVASEIPHAVRFARRLARALDGAVDDRQSGEVWSRSESRQIRRPERESLVSVIDTFWYCRSSDVPSDAASVFVNAARRVFPEALPRKFGEYEPLRESSMRWARPGLRRRGLTRTWCCSSPVPGRACSGASPPGRVRG